MRTGLPDRGALTTAGFRAAWRLSRAVPEPVAHAAVDRAADVLVRRGGPRVDQLRRNLSRARPGASPAELDALVRAGFRSYARYWCDVFRLPAWSRARTIAESVPWRIIAASDETRCDPRVAR